MIKAILCDFDGTLVDYNQHYVSGLPALIEKLKKRNIRFSIATGRPYIGSVEQVEKELGIEGIHILHAGAVIRDTVSNKILLKQYISPESVKKIVDYFSAQNLLFSVETIGEVYMPKFVQLPTYSKNAHFELLANLKDYSVVLKVLLYAALNEMTYEKVQVHKKKLEAECKDLSVMEIAVRNYFGLDVTSEKVTKHTAVLEYMKLLHLKTDEVVAIGDGPNDYPLFTACGYKIAMENAPKELKEIADLVVPASAEGGMKVALEHILQMS